MSDKDKTQKTDVAKRLNCSDELVRIMARELGLAPDEKEDDNESNDN